MVSASLQSGAAKSGAARSGGSWAGGSPSLTYCSSWRTPGPGGGPEGSGGSGAGSRVKAGAASLAHLSLGERNAGHGPFELYLAGGVRGVPATYR